MKFDELNLEEAVLEGLDAMNFQEMTPVQEFSIVPILEGKDVIACAQTGTGKTAAYVLPIINELSKGAYPDDAVNALIMVPTRELAQQVDQQIGGFSYYMKVSAVAVYGGTDGIVYAQQERGLQMGADIVIATPGRLIAHLNLGGADLLSRVSFFILDEADRMLDMGFYDDIIQIYKLLPEKCQIIMFSATMPPKIKTLAENIMKSPVEVEIAIAKPPESIMQTAYICYENQKLRILEKYFKETPPKRVIIFSSSKQKVKTLAATLKRMNINVSEMHSDLEQNVREQVMRDFKNGHIDVMVATDVVSRGIDINDISLIINYDIPNDPEDYVHRIGRTARGTDGKGLSITLVSEQEQYGFRAIEQFLGKDIYKIPVDPEFGKAPAYDPDKKRPERNDRRSGSSNGARRPGGLRDRRDAPNGRQERRQEHAPQSGNQTPRGEGAPQHKRPPRKQRGEKQAQHDGNQPQQRSDNQKPRNENQVQRNENQTPRGDKHPQQGNRPAQHNDGRKPNENKQERRRNGQGRGDKQRRYGDKRERNGNKQTPQESNPLPHDRYRNPSADNASAQNSAAKKRKWWEFWKG